MSIGLGADELAAVALDAISKRAWELVGRAQAAQDGEDTSEILDKLNAVIDRTGEIRREALPVLLYGTLMGLFDAIAVNNAAIEDQLSRNR